MKPLLVATAVALIWASQAAAGQVKVCVTDPDPDAYNGFFEYGPIHIPAGAVFMYAGHILNGNLQDPYDLHHENTKTLGWTDAPASETKRRNVLMAEDSGAKDDSAFVTMTTMTLTKARPCATARARAVLSTDWRWSTVPIFANDGIFYQIYGVMVNDTIDTSMDGSSKFDQISQGGSFNAEVTDTLMDTITLPPSP
jgi:hypothetical protein